MFASMMNPASTGPPADASPSMGPKAARALPSMSLGKVLVMIAMPCGMRSAPNPPCATRAKMRTAGLGARPADERGEGEAGHADEEHPALAVLVAQAPAHDQQGAHGQRVGGAKPLDQRRAAAQVGHDGGRGDVGDGRIEQVKQVGDQDHAEDGPHQPGRDGG